MTVDVDIHGRAPSHEPFDDQLPISALKEHLSIAVMSALAASAGLSVGEWNADYGCYDATLRSSHNYDPHTWGPLLDVQLKCTGQERTQRADHVAWQVSKRTTEYLSAPNRAAMSLLCVMVVDDHPGLWLENPAEGLLTYCKPYFLRGAEIPVMPAGQATQVVHLPYANLLTAPVLLDLMEEASRW